MLGRDVQRVEVVIFGFHFGAVQHREAERGEQVFDFVLNDASPDAGCPGAGRARAESDPAIRLRSRCFERFAANACFVLERGLQRLFRGVQSLAGAARSSGVSLPKSLLNCASDPLRPSTSTRTASSASSVSAAWIRAGASRLQFVGFALRALPGSSSYGLRIHLDKSATS